MSQVKQKYDVWTKCRFPFVYVLILLFLVLLYVFDMSELNFKSMRFVPQVRLDPNEGFVIKTSGCRIPFLDPFDNLILKYLNKPKHFVCSLKPPLISSNLTSIYVEFDALPAYNISVWEDVNCCYQPFWRADPQSQSSDNLYAYGKCRKFNSSVKISAEFIKVTCKINDTDVYKDFHSFVIEKPKHEVIKRSNLNRTGSDKINLLIIGLDAISRLNFHRQMPKSVSYLKNELNAYEFIGYNKVGDNTFPNLIPILTGLSEDELTKVCWQTTNTKFDDCPFIWKNFSKAGYATSFAEDSSWMGIFNYLKKGFKNQPTDYYWKTFNYLAEKEIGHSKLYNADLCLGPRPTYIVMLDYITKFIKTMVNTPYFSFFWGTSLSHDNLNFPSMGDVQYKIFFQKLKRTNVLNKTVLIVLSDHGIRWGGIRSTHQGQLEERLPFLFFVFPLWFQVKYSSAIANLRRNTRRLTTPYDLHETLTDILNLPNILPENIRLRSKNMTSRGISLFLQIPENRTCSTADIAAHWCTCQTSIILKKNDTLVIKAANFIVDRINFLLVGYKACSGLNLDKIMDARLLKTDDFLKNNSAIYDYTLIVKTIPGGGLFEATVRSVYNNDIYNETNSFNLTGTISRINLYGNQSSCITNFHLKLYCYCGG